MDNRIIMFLYAWALIDHTIGRMVEKSRQTVFDQESEVIEKRVKMSYHWKTGNWGICFSGRGPNSCGQGTRERSVWCVDSEEKTVLEFLCDGKREPERARNCFTACRHHKDKLKWEVGQWGPCLEAESDLDLNLDGNLDKERTESGEHYGLMQRNVSCILVSHDDNKVRLAVDEENCFTIARKPDSVRLCNIPKAQDCVVTEFTKWSLCKGCHSGVNQTRIRTVVVAPKNGGKPCPELSETRRCPLEKECPKRYEGKGRKEFRLKIFGWSKCETPNNFGSAEESEYHFATRLEGNAIFPMMDISVSAESSEKQTIFQAQVGYQTRDIVCKDSRGAMVDLSFCQVKIEELPQRQRACIVPQDCVASEWSAWMKLEEGCIEANGIVRSEVHERKRQVVRLPEGNGQPCPHLVEQKETSNKESLPLCKHKYKKILSKWSDCIITSGRDSMKVGCGGGIQLRTISCVSVNSGQPVEESHCAPLDDPEEVPTVQRCEVACPRDCVIGDWGRWGPCLRDDCLGNISSSANGYRIRRRKILIQPSVNGLPCPSVNEVQPCKRISCYRWSTGHWGACIFDPTIRCGIGTRKRTVKCIDSAKNTVDSFLCGDQEKPEQEEQCSVPCPFDCVLSPWSEWSPCSHPCSSEKMVALRQRNRTIIAYPGPGGRKCPNPDELTEMEPCNVHGCHGYSWLVLPWQSCISEEDNYNRLPINVHRRLEDLKNPAFLDVLLSNKSDFFVGEEEVDSKKTCGSGVRTREVWCVEDSNLRVADSKCFPLEKPPLTETCTKECPVNCQLSPWAEWSVCPQECVPDASNEVRDGEVAPTQSRSRVILKNPTNGGRPCQHLDEFRPCPLSAARCKHYQWQLSDWSECRLPANLRCGEGYRTRGVWCTKNQRAKVPPTFCVENIGPPPVLSEKCTVDCLRHCALSQWSSWSKCSTSCRGETVRTRQIIGLSSSRAACLNIDFYPLRESKTCPCELYTVLADDHWSSCILESSLEKVIANGRHAHDACGTGTRYKRNVCVNTAGDIVEPSFCELENSLAEEPCIVPCPVDCVQSQWSAWGECSSICGPGLQNRSREVIQDSREGGRPCGPRLEVKVCNTPCSNYKWASSGYTQCALNNDDGFRDCGTGEQYRTVRCLDYSQTGMTTQVRDEYCDPISRPEELSSCHISCPGECVISPWSAWSECDQSCSNSRQRQRTRVLLRSPSKGGTSAIDCPTLIQVQNCQINVTCFTYKWMVTTYGSCLPLGGSPCGEGIQTRAIYCQRSDGRFVSDDLCESKTKPATTEKWCYVECPIDCEMMPWSKWNSNECTCGASTGFAYRRRKIGTLPSSSGRPCPTNLEQRKPCPVKPCYNWMRGPWNSCKLEGAACGHGTSYRNISCLRGSTSVSIEECFAHSQVNNGSNLSNVERIILDLNTETNCYVPCHGDCEVSEWSSWSHCHRNCQNNPTGGYQTRSRAILKSSTADGELCPTSLWETKSCNSGPCLTFEWSTENENVVCRRSDGLLVLGGCDERKKPCLRNCSSIKNSRCVAGICRCLDGFHQKSESTSNKKVKECVAVKEGITINQKLAHPNTMSDGEDTLRSHLLYLPGDEFNIWMFAMIGIGCLFVVFVAVSFYLMCHNSSGSSQENGTQVLNASKP